MSHVEPMVIVWRWWKGHSVIDISHNRVYAKFTWLFYVYHLPRNYWLCFRYDRERFPSLKKNRQLFSNIIYVIQKYIEAINHITDTTDSWDVIGNVQCYALFTDFSKIKQLQPPLTHVAKPKGTLESATTASHVSKYHKIAILRCFGNYACVVNMMSIHTIYIYIYIYICYHNKKKEQKVFWEIQSLIRLWTYSQRRK